MKTFIQKGYGFDVGQDFTRAQNDLEIRLAPEEYAKPGYVIGYIAPMPASKLGFLRQGKEIRVHVQKQAIVKEERKKGDE